MAADLTRIYFWWDGTNLKGGCIDDSFLSAAFTPPAGFHPGNVSGTALSDPAGPLLSAQAHRTSAHP